MKIGSYQSLGGIFMMMKYILIITVSAAIILSGCSVSKGKTNSSNSSNSEQKQVVDTRESQMAEVDSIKDGIEQLIKTGKLKKDEKYSKYSQPYVPVSRVIFTDQNQTVRKYIQEAGDKDSSLKSSFYYDQRGQLRFAFFDGKAVSGTQIEHRIYFNSKGKRISETHKYIKGPVFIFPEKWLEDELITKPIEAFNK